jgi:hypothetical protein
LKSGTIEQELTEETERQGHGLLASLFHREVQTIDPLLPQFSPVEKILGQKENRRFAFADRRFLESDESPVISYLG